MGLDRNRYQRKQTFDDGFLRDESPVWLQPPASAPVQDAVPSGYDTVSLPATEPQYEAQSDYAPDNRPKGRFWRGALKVVIVLVLFGLSIWLGMVTGTKQQPVAQTEDKSEVLAASTDPNAVPLNVTNGVDAQLQGTDRAVGARQYRTTLENIDTNVTIQQAPDNFATDPDALRKFAVSMKASEAFTNAKWGKVYLAYSNGVQVALFAKNGYLGVVQSFGEHDNNVWNDFIAEISE